MLVVCVRDVLEIECVEMMELNCSVSCCVDLPGSVALSLSLSLPGNQMEIDKPNLTLDQMEQWAMKAERAVRSGRGALEGMRFSAPSGTRDAEQMTRWIAKA